MYHKALMDKKSPATVARLAKQAALMYGEVSALFNSQARAAGLGARCVRRSQRCRHCPGRGQGSELQRNTHRHPPPGQVLALHFEKSWVAHTQMKGSLLDVLALVEAAKQLNSDTKIAKEVAMLSVRRTLRPCACRGFAMQGWGRRA